MKRLDPEMRRALWKACNRHPDLARALLGLLDPEPETARVRRVRRTPTTAKMLRTG